MQIIHVNLAGSLGGGEYQTLALMRALSGKVVQCLVHRRDSPLAVLARQQSIETMNAGTALFSPFAPCWRESTVLHAHEGRGAHWARIGARLHSLPYIITRRILKAPRQRRWTKSVYRGASRVACVSQAVADSMNRYCADLKTCVVYDGQVGFESNKVNVAELRAAHPDTIIVAQVGRLSAEKEVRVTIEVARALSENNQPAHFWIIGDGPLRDRLQSASKGLNNVEFLGHRDNIGDYLEATDVLIHPSRDEAFGSVIVEAMQHKAAVIASRIGGIPEVVSDKESGLLVDSDNIAGFSTALIQLIADPILRARLANAGHQRAEFFSLQKMAKHYLDLYQECLVQGEGAD